MREVTLIGGPGDGKVIRLDERAVVNVVEYPHGDWSPFSGRRRSTIYRPERIYSSWPIPGWSFDPLEDFIRGGRNHEDGFTPLWFARVWLGGSSRKQMIEAQLDRLTDAIRTMYRVRSWERDDAANEIAERLVKQRVDELLLLTSPGYLPAEERAA